MRLKIKKTGSFKNSQKYLKLIPDASVYDVALKSPITFAPNISSKLGNKVFLKREDLQPIFSFKNRGAYNKIVNLTDAEKKRGVIAASAGNHAQGVASACKKLKINCLIVMPITTPEIKIKDVKRFGAKILQHGDNVDAALKEALSIAKKKKLSFVHPFDDPLTIAGQGTIGQEILEDKNDFDVIKATVDWNSDRIVYPLEGSKVGTLIDVRRDIKKLDGDDIYKLVPIHAWRRGPLDRLVALPPSDREFDEGTDLVRAIDAGMRIDVTFVTDNMKVLITPEELIGDEIEG